MVFTSTFRRSSCHTAILLQRIFRANTLQRACNLTFQYTPHLSYLWLRFCVFIIIGMTFERRRHRDRVRQQRKPCTATHWISRTQTTDRCWALEHIWPWAHLVSTTLHSVFLLKRTKSFCRGANPRGLTSILNIQLMLLHVLIRCSDIDCTLIIFLQTGAFHWSTEAWSKTQVHVHVQVYRVRVRTCKLTHACTSAVHVLLFITTCNTLLFLILFCILCTCMWNILHTTMYLKLRLIIYLMIHSSRTRICCGAGEHALCISTFSVTFSQIRTTELHDCI